MDKIKFDGAFINSMLAHGRSAKEIADHYGCKHQQSIQNFMRRYNAKSAGKKAADTKKFNINQHEIDLLKQEWENIGLKTDLTNMQIAGQRTSIKKQMKKLGYIEPPKKEISSLTKVKESVKKEKKPLSKRELENIQFGIKQGGKVSAKTMPQHIDLMDGGKKVFRIFVMPDGTLAISKKFKNKLTTSALKSIHGPNYKRIATDKTGKSKYDSKTQITTISF